MLVFGLVVVLMVVAVLLLVLVLLLLPLRVLLLTAEPSPQDACLLTVDDKPAGVLVMQVLR